MQTIWLVKPNPQGHAGKRGKKLPHGELNPGRPRDRRKCYQLHHEEYMQTIWLVKPNPQGHAGKRGKKLPHGELNPGRPRDRRKCYQLHHEELY